MYNISNTDQLITLALMLDHAYLTEMGISKYTCKRHNRQQLLALTYLNYQHFKLIYFMCILFIHNHNLHVFLCTTCMSGAHRSH